MSKIQTEIDKKHEKLAPLSKTLNEKKQAMDIVQSEIDLVTANQRNLETQRAENDDNLAKVGSHRTGVKS